MIDRIRPTCRPDRRACGFQQWRSLLFMHWPVPSELLRPLVPAPFQLDMHDGVAYVGLVPFAMQRVRPSWSPTALSFDFLETNVRTYVTHRDEPGVYFFSLDAASRTAVWVARRFWGLPYYYADMRLARDGDSIDYQSVRRGTDARLRVRCRLGERLAPAEPDTIEFFFLERYLLFLEQSGQVFRGQVHHTPYPAQQAEVVALDDTLLPAAGLDGCAGLPAFAHYSAGVDVEIFAIQPV